VVGVIGAALAAAALVLLWGATVAHAARVWQLRCRSSGFGSAPIGDDSSHVHPDSGGAGGWAAAAAKAEEGALPRHATLVHPAHWPPQLVQPATGAAVDAAPLTSPSAAWRGRGGGGSGSFAVPTPAGAPAARLTPPPPGHARTRSV
jgi:hypothetical protein